MADLNELTAFAAVARLRSFRKASVERGVSASALSHALRALEERLGVRLLQRTTRHFSVTDVGQSFYEHCKAMLVEAEAAQEAIELTRAAPRGTVRLSCPIALLHSLVAPMLAGFMRDHPQVTVLLEASNRRVDLVAEGIDVAIRVRPPPLPDSDLVLRVLAERSQCMVGSPRLFAGAPVPKAPADLADWPSLALGAPQQHYQWDLYGPDGARAQLRHAPRFVTGDMLTLRDAAVAGVGVVQLPTMLITEQVANGSLLPLMEQWRPQREIIHAVFPSRRGLLPAVRLLIDHLAQGFAALQEE
eukprot:gene13606-16012_t